MRDDARVDAPVATELGVDHLRRALVADEQTSLGGGYAQRDRARDRAREDQEGGEREPQERGLFTVERSRHDEPAREPRDERRKRRELEQLRRLGERRLAAQRLV